MTPLIKKDVCLLTVNLLLDRGRCPRFSECIADLPPSSHSMRRNHCILDDEPVQNCSSAIWGPQLHKLSQTTTPRYLHVREPVPASRMLRSSSYAAPAPQEITRALDALSPVRSELAHLCEDNEGRVLRMPEHVRRNNVPKRESFCSLCRADPQRRGSKTSISSARRTRALAEVGRRGKCDLTNHFRPRGATC